MEEEEGQARVSEVDFKQNSVENFRTVKRK